VANPNPYADKDTAESHILIPPIFSLPGIAMLMAPNEKKRKKKHSQLHTGSMQPIWCNYPRGKQWQQNKEMGRRNNEHQTWEETYTNTLTVDKENKQQRNRNKSFHKERERESCYLPCQFHGTFWELLQTSSFVGRQQQTQFGTTCTASHSNSPLQTPLPVAQWNTIWSHAQRILQTATQTVALFCMPKTRTSINCMAKTTWEHKTKQYGG